MPRGKRTYVEEAHALREPLINLVLGFALAIGALRRRNAAEHRGEARRAFCVKHGVKRGWLVAKESIRRGCDPACGRRTVLRS